VKNIVLSALAVAAFAGAASAQNTIEFRWVERHGQTSIPAGAVPLVGDSAVVGTGLDATILLALEARVSGGNAIGISTFGGDVNTNQAYLSGSAFFGTGSTQGGATPGTRVNNTRSSAVFETNYVGYVDVNGDPLGTGRGVFNPFRQIANLGDNAQGVLNDTNASLAGLQLPATNVVQRIFGNMANDVFLDNSAAAEFGLVDADADDDYIPLFITRLDVTSLELRTITITYAGFITAFSSYANGQPVESTTSTISTTYTVSVVPAPGAAALLGLGGLVVARRRRA